jgi:hypothetical protein
VRDRESKRDENWADAKEKRMSMWLVKPSGCSMMWQRIQGGEYESENGRWRVERKRRGWYLEVRDFDDNWEEYGRWDFSHWGERYLPFRSMYRAMVTAEEAEDSGEVEPWDEEVAEEHRVKRAEEERVWAEGLPQAHEWLEGCQVTIRPLPGNLLKNAQKKYPFSKKYADYMQQKALHAYVRRELTNYKAVRRQIPISYHGVLYPVWRKRVDAVVLKALQDWKARHPEAAAPLEASPACVSVG